jgi:beta-lactamase regulating signal transducer with metallopeptidase domain
MVAEASRELGLRRPPVTLMVDLAVSPMLWCGRRVRLVLPRPLWAQLDDVSRRAVICHELAHLRRRDHWVCRAEMIIGWVYWWHPVVWSARNPPVQQH